MGYANNIRIVRELRMLKSITINHNNIIINNDFNSSMDDLDNKSLENEKEIKVPIWK